VVYVRRDQIIKVPSASVALVAPAFFLSAVIVRHILFSKIHPGYLIPGWPDRTFGGSWFFIIDVAVWLASDIIGSSLVRHCTAQLAR